MNDVVRAGLEEVLARFLYTTQLLREAPSLFKVQLILPLAIQLLHFVGVGVDPVACNGHGELCGRRYSDVTMIGTHNSAFVGDSPVHNQYVSVTAQLDMGVRFLQAQARDRRGRIDLCHTYCWELDVGPLTGYLDEVSDWMGRHPDEVVTLLLTNNDGIDVDRFAAALETTPLTKLVFRPGRELVAKAQWPTLGELIKANTRLVIFMDYHADQAKVDYIMSEFDYFWETPYGVTDRNFPTCLVDRPAGGDPERLMGIMNHMLNYKIGDIVFPNQLDASSTNSMASIRKQVDLCKDEGKPQPNVILLDWVNIGDAQQVQMVLNGLA
ncbi:hypothetical protein RJ55_03203 [Drechmeria coniospora]|nr:hypothetical protein RJ55_03203 [Drechmeria coniospora]